MRLGLRILRCIGFRLGLRILGRIGFRLGLRILGFRVGTLGESHRPPHLSNVTAGKMVKQRLGSL